MTAIKSAHSYYWWRCDAGEKLSGPRMDTWKQTTQTPVISKCAPHKKYQSISLSINSVLYADFPGIQRYQVVKTIKSSHRDPRRSSLSVCPPPVACAFFVDSWRGCWQDINCVLQPGKQPSERSQNLRGKPWLEGRQSRSILVLSLNSGWSEVANNLYLKKMMI